MNWIVLSEDTTKSRRNSPRALSKDRSSILGMNVRWFELGALEALEIREFIARMPSYLSLLSNQWENFIIEILKSDWSIRKGYFPAS